MTLRRSVGAAVMVVLGTALLLGPATTAASALPHLRSGDGRPAAQADDPAPAAPTGLQASYDPATRTTTVGWDSNTEPDLAGYRLYRRLAESGEWTLVSGATPLAATFTTDPLPSTGDVYAYAVRAVDQAGNESERSYDWYIETPDTSPPGVPADLTARGTTAGNTVRWHASSDHVDHYEVWAAPAGGQDLDGPDEVRGTAYTDPRAPQDVAVTYTVEAVDASGQRSGVSGPVNATRPAPGTAPKPGGLTARHDGNGVLISWDGHSGDMGQSYRVYARYPDPSAWSFLATSYPRNGEVRVPGAGGLFYVVSADDENRESAPVYVGAY
ncbi:hypothetical protein [Streptomyces beigongshangae]|uniref:hypothetical protein n=1 Tax=Streptomyces beigongshangae TaxID=2841597 RepID=UPI001C8661F4|nr:hypothetical protein [Streptomyces sp. REN17]